MKLLIIITVMIFCNMISAQKVLDTIYANEEKNVAMFFPKPIRQGITGNTNFVFTYNREKKQYFALLQAKPGTVSNLLTITNDGAVYSYILKYSKILPKLNYFISVNSSIGNEEPIIKTPKINKETKPYQNKISYYQKFSEYLLKSKSGTMATIRKKGIKLQLQKMVYNQTEVYLVVEVLNRSGIDFEVDYINIYRSNGNKKKKASYQRLEQRIIHKHKVVSIIKNGGSKRMVFTLPKFVLGDNEKLLIELKELKGSRTVILKKKR